MKLRSNILVVLAGMGLLLLISCGGSKGGDAAQGQDVDAKLAQCLEKAGHGSSLEDVDARRTADTAFGSALDACRAKLGVDTDQKADDARTQAVDKQLLGLLTCLRDAGWDVPQPTRGPGGHLSIQGVDLNANVPQEQQAQFSADVKRCGGPDMP